MRRRPAVCMLVAVLFLAAGRAASAHKMMARSRVYDDGTVLLHAFFPDGKPARGVSVQAHRPDGSLFLTAKTDDEGKLTLMPDGYEGRWTATFTGSMGHKVSTSFELKVAGPSPREATAARESVSPTHIAGGPGPRADLHTRTHDEDLAEAEPFPWVNVLAGLGFILGLSALLTCLKLRSQLQKLIQQRGEDRC